MLVRDAVEQAEPVLETCKRSVREAGEGVAEHRAMDAKAAVRAEKAKAKRRAAMWAALDRKRGMGWSVEVETASRPVMPVGMSSMRSSSGTLRLGEEGLEVPEGPKEGGGGGGKG